VCERLGIVLTPLPISRLSRPLRTPPTGRRTHVAWLRESRAALVGGYAIA
jgi:hypothetical protein